MEEKVQQIKEDIYSAFSNTASAIGYDEVHGRIIAALIMNENPLSLQELADETNYSSSSISLSLDLLEVFGIIRKVKKQSDRKLYIELDGDLLEGLKQAIIIRMEKSIVETLDHFENYEEMLEDMDSKEGDKIMDGLENLKKQIERLEGYVEKLSEVEIPDDEK
ncbi:MAG: hypothetical protein ACLFS3_01520 [Candidatus Aenigmatarchaeota archaeon]